MKFRRKKRAAVDIVPNMCEATSLCVGTFYVDGTVRFDSSDYTTDSVSSLSADATEVTRRTTSLRRAKSLGARSLKSPGNSVKLAKSTQGRLQSPHKRSFKRHDSSFLRVADLGLSCHSLDDQEANYHYSSRLPPPGVDHDPQERWVAIDDGEGSHAPIAPAAVEALAKFGFETAMDQSMWTAGDRKTANLERSKEEKWWSHVWQKDGNIVVPSMDDQVLVWCGHFKHGLYGSDLPAIRAAGIVNMSPKYLAELLMDSSRVKEYNQLSLGRKDLLVLPGNFEEDGPFGKSMTRVMQSQSKPPLLGKILQFTLLMNARALPNGYLIVSRAVTRSNQRETPTEILHSEILMGVNVILNIEGHPDKCLMINVNHLRSPMVPTMVAKRIGLTAAAGFIGDLRALNKSE